MRWSWSTATAPIRPDAGRALLGPVLDGSADMTVGARRPEAGQGAMSPIRGLGNLLIRAVFRLLIGRAGGDLLSGYRAFNRHFLETVTPRSCGFEIEAELSSEAIARGMRVVEVPVGYHPRIAGTASKLRAIRDGLRIVTTIVRQGLAAAAQSGAGRPIEARACLRSSQVTGFSR